MNAIVPPKRARNPVAHLGRVSDVSLMDIPALEDCKPGASPLDYKVIVIAATMPEKVGSIFLPDEAQDRMGDAMQVGRIIAVSPLAFNYDAWPEDSPPPAAGAVVWFAKFAGALFTGADGREYRILHDKDIGMTIHS